MILNFFLFLHIVLTFLLIFFILLNKGKGSEVGALNTGDNFLSTKTSSNFLNKIVVILVILSLFSNFSITFISKSSFSKKSEQIIDVSSYK